MTGLSRANTGTGDPSTGLLFFFRCNLFIPASSGTNDAIIVPSGPSFKSTGTCLPEGDSRTPFRAGMSLGLTPSGARQMSARLPTSTAGSFCNTFGLNGLPGTD